MRRTWATVRVAATVLMVGGAVTAPTVASPATAATSECSIVAGTAGTPDLPAGGDVGFTSLAPAPAGLPQQVYLRTTAASFNSRWAFVLRAGRIYAKPIAAVGGWRTVPLPACLDGNVRGISADDDEVGAIGPGNVVYTMDHALNSPVLWNWTSRYGSPFWLGSGITLPGTTRDWSWSVDSPRSAVTWTDAAGNAQPVGEGKVTSLFALVGDGSRIVFLDPWLAADHSFQTQTPLQGRFQAAHISVSASTMFLMNKYGDMYTRQDDFDKDGSDTVFYTYSYDDQRGKPVAPTELVQPVGGVFAAVQLPVPGWRHQPKVPGEITGAISIAQNGVGSAARELRVEGRSAGHTGYWHKALYAQVWGFTRTDEPLSRPLQPNPAADWSSHTLAPVRSMAYAGRASGGTIRVSGFDVAAERSPVTVSFADGGRLSLVLYSVDALRQSVQDDDISARPRTYNIAVEVPLATWRTPLSPQARAFLAQFGGKRFTQSTMKVTTDAMVLARPQWTLRRN